MFTYIIMHNLLALSLILKSMVLIYMQTMYIKIITLGFIPNNNYSVQLQWVKLLVFAKVEQYGGSISTVPQLSPGTVLITWTP